jgi:hypothetical protein
MSDEEILREIAATLKKPRSRAQMIGEFFREAGLLLAVFGPLETIFNPGISSWVETAVIVGFGFGLGYVGIRLEEKQP